MNKKSYLAVLVVLTVIITTFTTVTAWEPNTKNYPPTTVQLDGSNVTGECIKVIDGDTIDVAGVGRIRFVGVNTPERGEPGYKEAKNYLKNMCLHKQVTVDVDNQKYHDRYQRILGVVYVDGRNLNRELLQKGYAQVMYIPPSEFNPYTWN